jgi:hypothetical protein
MTPRLRDVVGAIVLTVVLVAGVAFLVLNSGRLAA